MKLLLPYRVSLGAAFVLLAAVPAFARFRDPKPPPPPPVVQQNRAAQRAEARAEVKAAQPPPAFRPAPNRSNPPQRDGHLEKWMQNHRNLSLPEQQRALQNEPGFKLLSRQVQQNELNLLGQLYNMNPQQRSRMLSGVEGLERLKPQQRQQWNHAVQQLTAFPVPRRRLMIHAIADLREMPPDQRQQVIDSPRFAGEFSAEERQTMLTILTVYPPNRPSDEAP